MSSGCAPRSNPTRPTRVTCSPSGASATSSRVEGPCCPPPLASSRRDPAAGPFHHVARAAVRRDRLRPEGPRCPPPLAGSRRAPAAGPPGLLTPAGFFLQLVDLAGG